MSEDNTQQAPATTPEEMETRKLEALRSYRTRVKDWQKGKAMFLLSVHMWSGRKVQSANELRALGITDMEAYNETRSRGSKLLVPAASLQPIAKIKYSLEKGLMSLARRRSTFSNVYFFPQECLNEAVQMVMDADRQLKRAVSAYLDDPSGYDNDREMMIQKHMADVGKDQLGILVTRQLATKGNPPEGISEAEWKAQARKEVIASLGSSEEIARALGLSYDSFSQEYPTKDYIRAAHGVSFEILPLPYETKLNELLEQYELEKLAEGVAEDNAKARAELRKMLVDALQAFRKTMREKGGSDKINARTINRVREVFDQFQAVGKMLGDTEAVSRLIDSCKQRFEFADSWTVEEARSLGIESALEGLMQEANDMVIDVYREADAEGEMFVGSAGDDLGDMERDPSGDETTDRGMTT
jgi:hypothetical protein